jgi:Flp pilus assembly protein TadD
MRPEHLLRRAQDAVGAAFHFNVGIGKAGMGESSQWLESGQQYQQAGDLARAEQAFRQVLQADPSQAEVWRRLAQVCQSSGKVADALHCYGEALRLEPGRAVTHNSLGILQVQKRDLSEAAASFRRAIELQPHFVQAHNNLGNVLKEMGDRNAALTCYREAVRVDPEFADGHNNLGLLLNDLERFDEARDSFQHVARLQPTNATALNRLGILQARRKDFAGAVESFRSATQIRPDFAEAYTNLGNALKELGELGDQGDLHAALACYRQAVRLAPTLAEGHNNLGLLLANLGQPEGAVACYNRALELQPDYHDARLNRALAWLRLGDYERGWPEYEWRWGSTGLPARTINRPEWDGGPLAGRTILLHAEQGLGDTIQFVRYAPLVKARGGNVVLVCQPPLLRLLAQSPGVDQIVCQGDPLPPFDLHAPLLSLPRLFGTAAQSIPADVPYLRGDPVLVERWRQRLGPLPGLKVGIAWQGSSQFRLDHFRSVPLEGFAPLSRVPGVTLVSLQKGHGSDQAPRAPFPVVTLDDLDEDSGPFMDTAAVMKNLDLVVTPDTALAHLAGALAVRCWVALPAAADWRWLLEREDSPWYPTLRLFRALRAADWGPVFERMAVELRAQVGAPPDLAPIAVEIAAGELIDKITILQIKAARISDPEKLRNIRSELAALSATGDRALPASPELEALTGDLRAVNEALWSIEDEIRLCERTKDFGPRFVELARAVYRQNDQRSALKRRINLLLRSSVIEEKSYEEYEK